MFHDSQPPYPVSVNPSYPAFQLARALVTNETHADPETRERGRVRAEKWTQVINGLTSGSLAVGTRQPMIDAPVWATPEIVTGGFVTGRLLAGGDLLPFEAELAARLAAPHRSDRTLINAYYLTDGGLAELHEMLASGRYSISVPEEGALLTVAWLTSEGHSEQAAAILEAITPHFDRLRFYPKPTETVITIGTKVFLESVGTVIQRLHQIRPKQQIVAQREAIEVWTPLYDRMEALFLETVEGDSPRVVPDAEGRWQCPETRKFFIQGGWPCRRFSTDWKQRARCLIDDISRVRSANPILNGTMRQDSAFARLARFLSICAEEPRQLTGRDVGAIRLMLGRRATRRGSSGSIERLALQAAQNTQVAVPLHSDIAKIVADRLARLPADQGADETEAFVAPVSASEVSASVPNGSTVPPSLQRKVRRCLLDAPEALVQFGIVTSGETLAAVIPQFVASVRSQSFDSTQLRSLYASVYSAFRRRRSLLLLNFEKQVRLEELPWMAALETFRRRNLADRDVSANSLKEIAMLVLRAFPHVILPNKLLQEFGALAKGAEMRVPLVEELAADIFMDDFSAKFTEAARRAGRLLKGTLYARYYQIDFEAVQALPDWQPGKRVWSWSERAQPENPFALLCIKRANADESKRWDVARNGMVIEQSQILTTHNLAALFDVLDLGTALKSDLSDMAKSCFTWICSRLQVKSDNWHAKLIMLKNTAYAWRQMLFYLSFIEKSELNSFITWCDSHLAEQPNDFVARFAPAKQGLVTAATAEIGSQTFGWQFLGWTQGQHRLLEHAS